MTHNPDTFKKDWQKRQRALTKADAARAYLYAHLEADTGNIFYIGRGETVNRPWSSKGRGYSHRKRVKEHGLKVAIITDSVHSWEMSGWWETWWIAACRAAGIDLVNIADGGDGISSALGREIQNRPDVKANNIAKQKIAQNLPEVIEKKLKSFKKTRASKSLEQIEEERQNKIKAQNDPVVKAKHAATSALPETKAKRSAAQREPETNFRRSNSIKKSLLARTPEQIALQAKKAWETRRKNGTDKMPRGKDGRLISVQSQTEINKEGF